MGSSFTIPLVVRGKEMRRIAGFSNYFVNEYGDVYSAQSNKMLKPGTYANGYRYVQIRGDDGILKNKRVHLLVAETFIPNELGLPQVHHKDEDKLNNRVSNLEWCTGSYNQQQSAYKKHKAVEMLDLNGKHLRTFESLKDAASTTGIPGSTISRVCNGQRMTAGNYKWRYVKDAEN